MPRIPFLLALLISGCHLMPVKQVKPPPDPNPDPAGSACDASETAGLCYLYTGAKHDLETNRSDCQVLRGVFMETEGRCSRVGRAGKCTVLAGKPGEYVLMYYGDRKRGEKDCADPKSRAHLHGAGVWAPHRGRKSAGPEGAAPHAPD